MQEFSIRSNIAEKVGIQQGLPQMPGKDADNSFHIGWGGHPPASPERERWRAGTDHDRIV